LNIFPQLLRQFSLALLTLRALQDRCVDLGFTFFLLEQPEHGILPSASSPQSNRHAQYGGQPEARTQGHPAGRSP
jgi:hypothetical protein